VAILSGLYDTVMVLGAEKMSIKFPEQVKTIKMLCRVHRPTVMGIEQNAYQQSMLQVLRVDEETARLPIKGITTQGDKQRRIRGLAVLFENGAIRLPGHLVELEEELLHFPLGDDDLMDSLWLALEAVQIQRTEPKISFAEDLA
jgi:predicted phage terminase large subunit-like protein